MSLEELYDTADICKMEEKFSLIRNSDTGFTGKYPLEAVSEDARGTYGGEFVGSCLRAAYETIDDLDFDVHSLHSYFVKAGSKQSVMRYDVTVMSQGRNYCSRLVKCFQSHTDQLCFTMMASFTRKNHIDGRKLAFSQLPEEKKRHPRTKIPFEFSRSPHFTLKKYATRLDSVPVMEHTNGNLSHFVPAETWKAKSKENEPASREFGMFFRVNDKMAHAQNKDRTKMSALAFASDSLYLSTVMRAVFPQLSFKESAFFRVSLDHSLFFHDRDFDPTQWMFLDYRFERMSNDRVLVTSRYFTLDGRLVATASQEAICLFPLALAERSKYGSYKL